MIEVRVDGLLVDENNAPLILLREIDGDRVVPIFIGPLEASAIAYALQKAQFPRPMTLDMARLAIEGLGGSVRRVIVTRIEKDTFFAELVLESQGRVITIDARPSDSIGLALRTGATLFVAEEVMRRAGHVMSPADTERLTELRGKLRSINPEEFGNYRV